jgi:hypothetical protein
MLTRKQFNQKMRQELQGQGQRPKSKRLYVLWRAYEAAKPAKSEVDAAEQARRRAQQRRDLEKKRKRKEAAANKTIRAAQRTIPPERTIRELDEKFRARSEGL